jgi:hypothetical protein
MSLSFPSLPPLFPSPPSSPLPSYHSPSLLLPSLLPSFPPSPRPLTSSRPYHSFFKPISIFLSWLTAHPEHVRKSEENSQLVQLGNSLKIILRDLVSRVITKVLKESSFDDVCLLLFFSHQHEQWESPCFSLSAVVGYHQTLPEK